MKCHQTITEVFDTIKRFFNKALPDFIDNHVQPVLDFIEGLKMVTDAATPVLETLFPKIPPALLSDIDKYLGDICAALQIEIDCKGTTSTFEDRLQCIAAHLSTLDPELRHSLEIKLASWLVRVTSGAENISADQIDAIVQFSYSHYKHLNTPVPND